MEKELQNISATNMPTTLYNELEFAIFLDKLDYKKYGCADAYVNTILNIGKMNNIRIIIVNTSEENELNKIIVHGKIELRTLYIKLPSNNMYINSDQWEKEYSSAKLREINMIFTLLGAKKIVYKQSESNKNNYKNSALLSINNNENGYEYSNKNEKTNKIYGCIELANTIVPEVTNFDELVIGKKLYYTLNDPDIQYIVNYKLENRSMLKYAYTYQFSYMMKQSYKFISSLSLIGISIGLSSQINKEILIEYDIEF